MNAAGEMMKKFSVSMPPALRKALALRAKQQKRSVSAQLQYLVERDLKGSGIEVPTESQTAEVGA